MFFLSPSYETWNMAFCSHYAESPYFYAKLLAPSVTCADPKEYLFHRSMALYLHIHGVMYSRVARAALREPVYAATNWDNPAMTRAWGTINKNTADQWFAAESLGVTFQEAASAVRADAVVSVAGKIISSTVVVSVGGGISGTSLKMSDDLGRSVKSVPLSEGGVACAPAKLAGMELCFKREEAVVAPDGTSRQLAPQKTKLVAFVRGLGWENSPQLNVLETFDPHPCLSRAWAGASDRWTVRDFATGVANTTESCSVLAEQSFLSVGGSCHSVDGSCSLRAKVEVSASDGRRLSAGSSVEKQTLELKFLKKDVVVDKDIRVQLELNGYRLFDIDLLEQEEQCMSAPNVLKVCVERSRAGTAMPAGWEVAEDDSGSSSGRRQLQSGADSFVSLAVDILGTKRFFPLAVLKAESGVMSLLKGVWTGINDNEGFDATKTAKPHDECRYISCTAPGFSCYRGAKNQAACFPSLFSKPAGESRTWLQQLIRLAKSPYDNAIADQYQEDGWSVHDRFCLTHDSEFLRLGAG